MNSFFDYSDLRRICFEALVIFCFGILVGLTLNGGLVRDLLAGKLTAPSLPARDAGGGTLAYPEPVDLQTVRELAADDAVLVDARIEELHRQGHLPGSVLLPLADFEAAFPAFRERYPLTTPLIVYCSGYGCPDSFDLSIRLLGEGYQDVMVFEGGFPEWESAGLPVEEGK